ncbi:hypothetical protein LCGC14_0473980 [marine sediment metagenome]|uniref:Uncharacterized protein n=1 Tax=marine sediment metagenome TaxID=412755 RepID=A0A0F9VK46_9ZZZZ
MKKIIKEASYWLYCPKCSGLYNLEGIEEIRLTSEVSRLVCTCGYSFPHIEKNWTFFDEGGIRFGPNDGEVVCL